MNSYPAHRSACEKTIMCYNALILVLICFVCVVLVLCLSVCAFYVLEARPPGIWTLMSPGMANDPVFDPTRSPLILSLTMLKASGIKKKDKNSSGGCRIK